MLGIPNYTDRTSELNRWVSKLTPVAAVVLLILVIVMQQFLRTLREPSLSEPPEAVRVSEEVREPGIESLVLQSKFAVKAREAGAHADWAQAAGDLDKAAQSRTDKLRAAIVAGELVGKQAAVDRLRTLKGELAESSELRTDVDWVLRLYRRGRDELPAEAVDSLIARHGWFGRLALAFGARADDPYRQQTVKGMNRIRGAILSQGLVYQVVGLAGMISLVAMLVKLGKGGVERHFSATGLPPGIYLEMFTAFLQMFLILLCVGVFTLWLSGAASVAALVGSELLLWLIPACFAWPFLRGTGWVLVSPDLGLHAGAGPLTEVRWGAFAFLLITPVSLIVGILAAALSHELGLEEEAGKVGGFPTFQRPLSGSWIPVVIGALSTVVWAPLTEELLFRGALYRYLRSWAGVAVSALLCGAVFGAIHPYGGQGIAQVAASGVLYALLREWRGSLIAPIVAHALHNGTITLFQIWTIAAIAA